MEITEYAFCDFRNYFPRINKTSENAHELLWKDVTVVWISQWYHVARVKLSLKQVWFESVYGYAPKYFEGRDIYSIMRELPAYFKYILNY